jgi:hypothetical protein
MIVNGEEVKRFVVVVVVDCDMIASTLGDWCGP